MSWRKEYKAAQQRRIDKIAKRKKFDEMLTSAFESGKGSVLQSQHRTAVVQQQAQIDARSAAALFRGQQQAQVQRQEQRQLPYTGLGAAFSGFDLGLRGMFSR